MDEAKYNIRLQGTVQGFVQGDHNNINLHYYGKNGQHEEIYPVWGVPYLRNLFFTGRENVLRELHDLLSTQSAVSTSMYAISGLGGIGKTQLAVEYVFRYREEYQAILWVRADSRETILADFVTIASLLHLSECYEQDQMVIVQAVKRWFAEHGKWLLILDNADDLELVFSFIPSASKTKGHIILTTWNRATGKVAGSIQLEKMTQEEGRQLLLKRAKIFDLASEVELSKADDIVTTLGSLPLAIDQAGAYIEETSCSLWDYLELYQNYRAKLLRERGNFAIDHPDSVTTTFSLAFEKVKGINPTAVELLHLAAFLYPDVIPEEFFTDYVPNLDPDLKPLVGSQMELNASIRALLKYSLVQRSTETKTFTIHRLVQAILQDEMDEQACQQWEEYAVRAVSRSFPFSSSETWSKCQRYMPHANLCTELINKRNMQSQQAAGLLYRMGCFLNDRGYYDEAVAKFHEALIMTEQNHWTEHNEMGLILNKLASAYHAKGEYRQAETLYQRALEDYQRVLGTEHPDIALVLDSLAGLYRDQGKYKDAESLYQKALQLRKKRYGSNHKQVGATLNNLALLYYSQGRFTEAERHYLEALKIKTREPESIDLASNLCNLAETYRVQGKLIEAEALSQRALDICERIQGPDHPEVAAKVSNLGNIYLDQGKYIEAEKFFLRAIKIRENTLGSDDPYIAQSLSSLGVLYHNQGNIVEAEVFLKRAWAIGELGFGPTHPYVATYISNLAFLYHHQCKYTVADRLYRQAISIWESHELDHPGLAGTLLSYANLLRQISQADRALQIEKRANLLQSTKEMSNKIASKKNDQARGRQKTNHARKSGKKR